MMRRVLAGFVSLNRLKRLIGFICLVLVFISCYTIDEYEIVRYKAPNWTSDGRIVFVEDYNFVRDIYHPVLGLTDTEGWQELTLCEIDYGGKNLKQIVKLARGEGSPHCVGITSTSSAGEWVAVAMRTYDSDHDEIFVVKRDGTGFKNLGEGSWPDLSPDGKKIVYQKPNQGLWIKNIDGAEDHPLSINSLDTSPAWSSDGNWIAYVRKEGWNDEDLWIMNTSGDREEKKRDGSYGALPPDWAPPDTNALVWDYIIVYLSDNTTRNIPGASLKWSPDGSHFVGYDPRRGLYVMKVDGSNKIYLEP